MRAPRIAFRCDGDDRVGAGHVARCLPLAGAFAERGWEPVFVGRFAGLAAWLLERAGLAVQPPQDGPAGVEPTTWAAAVADGYELDEGELCALAEVVPLATVAEAARCERAGVHVDYHIDRAGDEPSPRLLPGPAYAPVDHRFAAARRDREDVQRVLVTVGGSTSAHQIAEPAIAAIRRTFPDAAVWLASAVPRPADEHVRSLPFPGLLLDVVKEVDLAVSAAGLTAYELACAGVPAVLVAVAPNQRRVVEGFRAAGAAVTLDAERADTELPVALAALRNPATRARLAAVSCRLVDGAGAARAAERLQAIWGATGHQNPTRR